jgi:hypothetical protein
MIEHQRPLRISAALALPINFSDRGAGDFEDSLFSACDTDHRPGFSNAATIFFPVLPHLLDLDAVSFGSSPESHHQVSYGEEFVIRL